MGPQHGAVAATVVAKLAKFTAHGYGLRLTPTGQALPAGLYELQLVATSTTRSPT